MTLDGRARLSGGSSLASIHHAVAAALSSAGGSGRLVDVGCGAGGFAPLAGDRFRYLGVDAVAYEDFPPGVPRVRGDFDRGIPLADAVADAVVAIETIEHLENPWSFMRELVRITRRGGWVVVSTPNQLSALSLLTLAVRGRFASFQDVHYPAHRTALLEVDLRRIAADAGLERIRVSYSLAGRLPLTATHYPAAVARLAPRLFSDTVILAGQRPGDA